MPNHSSLIFLYITLTPLVYHLTAFSLVSVQRLGSFFTKFDKLDDFDATIMAKSKESVENVKLFRKELSYSEDESTLVKEMIHHFNKPYERFQKRKSWKVALKDQRGSKTSRLAQKNDRHNPTSTNIDEMILSNLFSELQSYIVQNTGNGSHHLDEKINRLITTISEEERWKFISNDLIG